MNERGFTLVELLVSAGILAAMIPVLGTSIHQIIFDTDRNNTAMTALAQVEGGARVLGKDIRAAQDTHLVSGAAPVTSMTLYWMDWSDDSNYDVYGQSTITYNAKRTVWDLSGTDLERTEGTCSDWDPAAVSCNIAWVDSSPRVISRYVTSAQFSLDAAGEIVTASFTSSPFSALGTSPSKSKSYDLKVLASFLGTEAPVQ